MGLAGGIWNITVKNANASMETPTISASYTWSDEDRKCCDSFFIQRYYILFGHSFLDNDPSGLDGVNGNKYTPTSYADPDQPGWIHGRVNIYFKLKFTWNAVCLSGPNKGGILSSITKTYTNNWGDGTLSE